MLVRGQRRPELDAAQHLCPFEARRHDADHRERDAVQRDGLTDHGGIGAEAARPQGVADHQHGVTGGLVLVRRERASARRLHTQHLKVVASDELSADAERLGATDHVGTDASPRGQAGELRDVVAEVEIVGQRQRLIRGRFRHHREHLNQLLRIAHRQRPEENGVDQREDGGVGADAEGQRQHDDQRECSIPDRQSDGPAYVLQHQ